MSNSTLICYTKISPYRTAPRNHKIDTITIHCMAGNFSVETCGDIFQRAGRNASSNYGIGSDGRIGMYVEEKDRSWCSSNRDNDHRAITIEVANDGGAPEWHVSDKAMSALLDLVTDICKRNGISKLVWSDKKSDRTAHRNGCNMTVHRDFAKKECPGKYLFERQAWIAEQVNGRLEVPAEHSPVIYYTVVKGDTLSKISQRYNVSVSRIMELNPAITNPNMIRVGQKIRLS